VPKELVVIEQYNAPSQGSGGDRTATPLGAALLLALSLILTACEYPGIPHPLAAQVESPASAGPSPTPSLFPTPQNPGSGEKEVESPQENVQISLKDFRLDPDKVTGKAGAITFVLKNEGRYTHDFRVEGQGLDEKAPKVGQGRTFEWQVTLPLGTYRISCPISNHADRGMTGTLEVVP
jgi:plastocyanin